jgi:hypothetical protein
MIQTVYEASDNRNLIQSAQHEMAGAGSLNTDSLCSSVDPISQGSFIYIISLPNATRCLNFKAIFELRP